MIEIRAGFVRALEVAVVTVLGFALATVVAAQVTEDGPIDYRMLGSMTALILVMELVLLGPWWLLVLARRRVTLTDKGIPALGVDWSQVTGVAPVWRGNARQVGMAVSGRGVFLPAPLGAWWRPDSRFARDVTTIRRYAIQHGARLDTPVPGRSKATMIATALVVVAIAVSVVAVLHRGVISPWTPVAGDLPDGCAALDGPAFVTFWPRDRILASGEDTAGSDYVRSVECHVTPALGTRTRCPYAHLTLQLIASRDTWLGTGVGDAMDRLDDEREHVSAIEVSGLGDDAVQRDDGTTVELLVRRANLTVRVAVQRKDLAAEAGATEAARALAGVVLKQVEFR